MNEYEYYHYITTSALSSPNHHQEKVVGKSEHKSENWSKHRSIGGGMVSSRGVDSKRRSKAFKCAKIANEAKMKQILQR